MLVFFVGKEVFESYWVIKGCMMDKSKCGDDTTGLYYVTMILLVIGVFKILLYALVVVVLIVHLIGTHRRNRNQQRQSKDILRNISRVPYMSLVSNDPESECIICYNEYTENDMVTKLDCNEKHFFHTECITGWIEQGKNSCPICRAPINEQIAL